MCSDAKIMNKHAYTDYEVAKQYNIQHYSIDQTPVILHVSARSLTHARNVQFYNSLRSGPLYNSLHEWPVI